MALLKIVKIGIEDSLRLAGVVVRHFWISHIVDSRRDRRADCSPLSNVQGHQPCGCQIDSSYEKISGAMMTPE